MARSEVNYIFDAATAFRAPGSAAVTATGVIGTSVKLDKLANVRPSSQRGKLGAEGYKVVIVVESATAGTYAFSAETGAAGAATVKVGEVSVAGAGQYVLHLDAATIEKLDPNHEVIELNLAVTGEAASIRFSAWLV